MARTQSAVVVDSALEAGLRRMGASDADVARIRLERGTALAHDPNECEVWPENWPAWSLFCQVSTQWRVGMGGATGLDYGAIYPLLDRIAQDAAEWMDLFDDLQVLEGAAL